MARRIQLRRDTAANWSSTNPTLAQGEIGIDLTNNKLKIGNGSTAWNSLAYFDDKETALSNYAGHIVPSADNTYDLGAPDKQWRDIFVSNGSVYIGDIKLSNDNGTLKVQQVTDAGLVTETPVPNAPGAVTTDRLINGENEVVLKANGQLEFPLGTILSELVSGPDNIFGIFANAVPGRDVLIRTSPVPGVFNKDFRFRTDGKLQLPQDGDIVDSNGTSVLGGGANLGELKISSTTIGTKDFPDTGNWGGYNLYLDPGGESYGYIQIPSVQGQTTGGQLVIANNNVGNGGIRLSVNGGDLTFTDAGLEVPYNHHIRQNNSWTRVTTPNVNFDQLGTIVWTSTVDYISSAKLVIQVEADEAQDATGWHSQACEAIISCRGYASGTGGPTGDPQMIVYGVVHTSVNPLVTFTVRRNPGSGLVEVIGTLTATAASAANLRIHSVEMSTRD